MGKTQEEIYRDVAERREVSIERLADFEKVPWLPRYKYEEEGGAERLGKDIDSGTVAHFTINETTSGIQLVAFHYNTGVPSHRELDYPFTEGQFEDAINDLDDECAEPFQPDPLLKEVLDGE